MIVTSGLAVTLFVGKRCYKTLTIVNPAKAKDGFACDQEPMTTETHKSQSDVSTEWKLVTELALLTRLISLSVSQTRIQNPSLDRRSMQTGHTGWWPGSAKVPR